MDAASNFYFKGRQSEVKTDSLLPLDNDWVRSSFLISLDDFPSPESVVTDKYVLKYMYWSRASLKFTNTAMGGNIGVNCKPQFCRYTDIRVKGLLNDRLDVSIYNQSGNNGMGSYYSEAFDDNAQRIYFRFGLPQFNSLLNFVSTMFSADLSNLANQGVVSQILYTASFTAARTYAFLAFFPMSALFMVGKLALNSFNNKSISSFYSVRPTMPLYWSAVNDMVNTISVLRGILPPSMMNASHLSPGNTDYSLNLEVLQSMQKLMPGIINEQFGIDVFALANRVQLIQNRIESDYTAGAYPDKKPDDPSGYYDGNPSTDPATYTTDQYAESVRNSINSSKINSSKTSLADLIKKYNVTIGSAKYSGDGKSPNMLLTLDPTKLTDSSTAPTTDTTATTYIDQGVSNAGADAIGADSQLASRDVSNTYRDPSTTGGLVDYFEAEAQSGGGFACFVVEHTGSISDSFSSDFEDSQIASTLNNISSSARSISYNVANGNILPGMESLLNSAKSVVFGTLDGFNLGGIARLLLGSYLVDIPKFWSGSTASLGKSDYNIELNSPYGNAISQLQNIYIPLSMLLVGALPLSAGRQTYTSPFICQLFDRGRTQVSLGMIDNISVTRGTTNLPFNKEFRPLGLKVSFSVVNLNKIMHVPVSKGTFFGAIKDAVATTVADGVRNVTGSDTAANIAGGFLATSLTDDDGLLFNYLSAVTGVSAKDSLYKISRARITLAIAYKSAATLTSPAAWANRLYGVGINTPIASTILNVTAGLSNAAILNSPSNVKVFP